MSLDRGFAEMVLYIEACESGSIFQGTLQDGLKIYAVVCVGEGCFCVFDLTSGACHRATIHICELALVSCSHSISQYLPRQVLCADCAGLPCRQQQMLWSRPGGHTALGRPLGRRPNLAPAWATCSPFLSWKTSAFCMTACL